MSVIRTGPIISHLAHRYGARLQALAAMWVIQFLGHDREIISYRLSHTIRTNQPFKKSDGVRGMASDTYTALHYGTLQCRFRRFEVFVVEEMALSSRRYTTFEQLRADPPVYDVYVADSDQIWNPHIFQDKQFDPSFLLGLARKGHRIAYAPSLGVSELPEDEAKELRRFPTPLSALSVRERRGQVLLREAARRDARVVLDPILLLTGEDWGELATAPKRQKPYIPYYFVSDFDETVPCALTLSARTGWPIVQLMGARRKIDGAVELVSNVDPRELLGLFRHAFIVVTNSLHGAAFSLQFQRSFFTSMSPREQAEPTLSCTYNLFSQLGYADRILGLDTTAPADVPMDHDAIYEKLAVARADSLFYPGAAIEGVPLSVKEPEPQTAPHPVLCRAEDCTGCTICASARLVNAIAMEPNHEDFLWLITGERCTLRHRCEQICPIFHPSVPGPVPAAAYAVWDRDEIEWTASFSGGFLSLLVRHMLEQEGAVSGTALNEDMTARHVCARTMDELVPMRGSKYVQSDLGGSLSQVRALLEEGMAMFSFGVPCQVDGLKRCLGRDHPNLLICNLMCHGVPSPAVSRAYLDGLETARGSKVVSVRFKDKSHGWPRPWFATQFADGNVYTEDFNRTDYGRDFGMQLFLRPARARRRCTSTSCPVDFTLADYWGLDEKSALPVERDEGVFIVLVDFIRGQAVFDALSPRFGQVERPLAEAVAGNPQLASPLKANLRRAILFATFVALPFAEVEKRSLALSSLPYRATAKMLTPVTKEKIHKLLK